MLVNVADMTDPKDPAGRSYRQVNADKLHEIPLYSLVEIVRDADESDSRAGARLFVVHHARDCDMTPLYVLAVDPSEPVYGEKVMPLGHRLYSRRVYPGFPEQSLKLIRTPETT